MRISIWTKLYTALSRAKSASDLYIGSILKLSCLEKIVSKHRHNVYLLNKHWEDLIVDPLIFTTPSVNLQETMTLSTDSSYIPGHIIIDRTDGNARTSGSGAHILISHNPALCKFLVAHSSCQNGDIGY